MDTKTFILAPLLGAMLLLGACATTTSAPAPDPDPAVSTYFEDEAKSVRSDIYIGSQPGAIDIAALAGKGITHVINFRTPKEMERLEFDEAELLGANGIAYTPIPIGGEEYPYTPAAVDQLTALMKNQDGSVLLHCGSGYRASIVAVAWLVQEQGMPLEEALTHAQGWWPLRLEQVMDRSFKLVEE